MAVKKKPAAAKPNKEENAQLAKRLARAGAQVIQFKKRESVAELIARRVEFLTGYQNAAYAADYQRFVEKVRAVEAPLGKSTLTAAVARYLFKLMAYKDEYEVARLHSDPAFHARLASQFEGDFKLQVHLAPPLIAKKNNKGELVKQKFGPYMFTVFRWLAKFKGLRGTALDIFGRTEERRTERALIGEYREAIESLLDTLDAGNHALALEIARLMAASASARRPRRCSCRAISRSSGCRPASPRPSPRPATMRCSSVAAST